MIYTLENRVIIIKKKSTLTFFKYLDVSFPYQSIIQRRTNLFIDRKITLVLGSLQWTNFITPMETEVYCKFPPTPTPSAFKTEVVRKINFNTVCQADIYSTFMGYKKWAQLRGKVEFLKEGLQFFFCFYEGSCNIYK